MAVRSRLLGFSNSVGTTTVVLLLVPAGRTAIVKHVVVENISTTTAVEAVLVVRRAGMVVGLLRESIPMRQTIHRTQWELVLEPGDQLDAVAVGTGLSFRCMVAGVLLLGAPE